MVSMMTTEQQIDHIAAEARKAAAKRTNNWPGLPASSLPLSLGSALATGIAAGRLEIVARPSIRPNLPEVQYIVAVQA